MLIIDESADKKLIKTLESARRDNHVSLARCLHFKFSSHQAAGDLKSQVIRSAQDHLATAHPEIYCCEDGDIYILTHAIPSKMANQVILDIAEHMHMPASDALAHFYELDLSVNELLVKIEQKLEKKRALVAQFQKAQEQQQAEQRREHILQQEHLYSAEQIQQRRTGRQVPELMIIEDDAFSRRLVENVLQKQYPLTALASADRALFTYSATAPDLLFLDINLPDVSGMELLERIIAIDPRAYVIMLSGNADAQNITQAMKLGAKGFVAKPFTREKLMQYIQRCPTTQH